MAPEKGAWAERGQGATHMFTKLKRGQHRPAPNCIIWMSQSDGWRGIKLVGCSLDVTYRSSSVGFWVNLSMMRDDLRAATREVASWLYEL